MSISLPIHLWYHPDLVRIAGSLGIGCPIHHPARNSLPLRHVEMSRNFLVKLVHTQVISVLVEIQEVLLVVV